MAIDSRHSKVIRKSYFIAGVLMGINLIGIGGYMVLENYSFWDAFYMTIQTVSTVGFNEVHPFTGYGKQFTIFLIITSFGTFAYGVTVITQFAIDGTFRDFFNTFRVQKQIDELKDHVIICGFGRNGRQAAQKMTAYQRPYVVIDTNEELIKKFRVEFPGLLYILGDATEDETLHQAGIKRAKYLIGALHNDADNLFLVVSARQLNPSLKIVSRANEDSTEKKLRLAGSDYTIQPNKVGGMHMADQLINPDVTQFLDLISVGGSSEMNIEEISVDQISSEGSIRISELEIRKETGCNIIGLKTEKGEFIINPGADMVIPSKAKLFVIGNTHQIKNLQNYLNNR
ncbi:MAG: NAD-binding protein [Bacteroidota bacterium]|nr:NAD-binding protein [Bacteroidota bacterium]MDX5447192.1 NAD-binding protein [Bacteroidota bacterium]MDX5504726.1 NAD-binding protein [Bacteroidota bacterium]